MCTTITFKLKNNNQKDKTIVEKDKINHLFIYKLGEDVSSTNVNNSIRLSHAINGMYILFKILKNLLKSIPINVNVELDFSYLFNFLCKLLTF